MKIIVNRFVSDQDTTLSTISLQGEMINGKHFECFGLEDEYREHKLIGETRIPAGVYNVRVRQHGGFHKRYSHRFASIHDGMLEIMDVPCFTDILIHCGNTDDNTDGCLLVGMGAITNDDDMRITSSVLAYKALYPQIIGAARRSNLTIQFIDGDRS